MEADDARSRYHKIRARFAGPPPTTLDLAGALSVRTVGRDLEIVANGATERLTSVIAAARPESLNAESLTLEEIFVASRTLSQAPK